MNNSIKKTLETFEKNGGVPRRYDMNLKELKYLYRLDAFQMINKAFEYGFIKGTRYENKKKKRQSAQ